MPCFPFPIPWLTNHFNGLRNQPSFSVNVFDHYLQSLDSHVWSSYWNEITNNEKMFLFLKLKLLNDHISWVSTSIFFAKMFQIFLDLFAVVDYGSVTDLDAAQSSEWWHKPVDNWWIIFENSNGVSNNFDRRQTLKCIWDNQKRLKHFL